MANNTKDVRTKISRENHELLNVVALANQTDAASILRRLISDFCARRGIDEPGNKSPVISEDVWLAAVSMASARGVEPFAVIADVLNKWGEARRIEFEAIEAHIRGDVATTEEPVLEKSVERELAMTLRSAGYVVDTQVQTKAGVADIVATSKTNRAMCVIEVKRDFRKGPRDVHHACGQAKGYAEALGASGSVVCAPGATRGQRFGVQVCAPDDLVYVVDLCMKRSTEAA